MLNLLKINEATALALHTIEVLARNSDRLISTHDIAEELKVSENHLAKVHQRLTRAGIVKGTRGPGGGFHLARPADEIKLLDIFEAMEGPFVPNRCLLGRPLCQRDTCILGDMSDRVNAMVREFLTTTTAAKMAAV